jgi:acyl carrier protein
MTTSDIASQVHDIISQVTGVPRELVQPEVEVRSLPDFESIMILRTILELEKRFDIEIPAEVTFEVETIGDLDAVVARLVSGDPS